MEAGSGVMDPPAGVQDPPVDPQGDGGGEPETAPPGELVLGGSEGQLSFGLGGNTKKPTSASLRLTGGKVEIEGQFDKGERLIVEVEIEVREVAFRDEVDSKTGQTVGCQRRHKAAIVGIARA